MYALFTHCAYTVHVLKNIKNGSHDTIYIFKYYFATVFSVFSFQYSATISSNQTHPIFLVVFWLPVPFMYNQIILFYFSLLVLRTSQTIENVF